MTRRKMEIKRISREAVKFGLVGLGSTIITYIVYYILNDFVYPTIAYTIAYLVGIFFNYVLNTLFTFKTKYSIKKISGFIISHGFNLLLSLLLLNFFVYIGMSKDVAPIPMYSICIPINFLMVRYFLTK